KIASGEPLVITIVDPSGRQKEYEAITSVDDTGNVTLPPAGAVFVRGKTFDEAQAAIADAYRAARVLSDARVTIRHNGRRAEEAADEKRFVKIVIGKQSLLYDGHPI